jgi:hypothetical protein
MLMMNLRANIFVENDYQIMSSMYVFKKNN